MYSIFLYRVGYTIHFLGQMNFWTSEERDGFIQALQMNSRYGVGFSDTDAYLTAFRYPEEKSDIIDFDRTAVYEMADDFTDDGFGDILESGYDRMIIAEAGEIEVSREEVVP